MAFSRGGWETFAPAKPIAVKGGIASSKTRGAMADAWWSKRFVSVLESYGLGGRMTRGRTYARKGQVVSIDVDAGLLTAEVQGSRPKPYSVTIRFATPSQAQWLKIDDALRAKVGYAARLLAGEVPNDLEDVFLNAGCQLFPIQWRDLSATCSCPDWGDPCKHQAAALYVFADQLDADPWQLLALLGRSRDDIVGLFSSGLDVDILAFDVAPWWPLRPGAPVGDTAQRVPAVAVLGDEPGAVLARVGTLDAVVQGRPASEILSRAYVSLSVRSGDAD